MNFNVQKNIFLTLFFPILTHGGYWKNDKWIPGNPTKYWGDDPYQEIWECFIALLPLNENSSPYLPPLWIFALVYLALILVAAAVYYEFLKDEARRRLKKIKKSREQPKVNFDMVGWKSTSLQKSKSGHARAWKQLALKQSDTP